MIDGQHGVAIFGGCVLSRACLRAIEAETQQQARVDRVSMCPDTRDASIQSLPLTLWDDQVAERIVRNQREQQQVEQREHVQQHPQAVRLGCVADPRHIGELHRKP